MTSRSEISKRLLLVNSASSVVAQVINVSVLVWLNQYLLRRISPEEYSLYPVVMSLVAFIPLFTGIMTAGLGRYIVEAYAQDDDRRVTEIVSTMFPLLCGAGVLLLALGGLLAWNVDKVLTIAPGRVGDARLMIFLMLFSLALQLPCAPFGLGMYVRQKFVLSNVVVVSVSLIKSTLLLVLLLGVSTRVLWVVVSTFASHMCAMTVNIIISLRLIPALRFRYHAIRWELAGKIMSFGGWSFLAAAAGRLRNYAVPLVLNELACPLDVACFQVGSMAQRQINEWTDVISRPFNPVITSMHAIGAKGRIRNAYLRAGRLALWWMLAVAVPAAIYARELIQLYVGGIYMDAAIVMILTLAIYPLAAGSWLVWGVASATGRMRSIGIRVFVSQLASLALVIYLVAGLHLGAVGAAAGGLAAAVVGNVVLTWPLGLHLADVEFKVWVRQTLIPGLVPASLGALAWVALGIMIGPDTWVKLGLCTLIGLLCYGVVLLIFCLEPQDRADLAEIIARIKHRVGLTRG